MPANKKAVTDSEYELMKILWESDEPITSAGVLERLGSRDWKITTVATLLTRLCDKGAVSFEKRGRNHYYSPELKESEYKVSAAKSLISRIYNGSVKNLVAALYESDEISEEDIDELKNMFKLDK